MKNKRFFPIKLIYIYAILVIVLSIILVLLWIFWGDISLVGLTISWGGIIIFIPIFVFFHRKDMSVVISEKVISNYSIDKNASSFWTEEIVNLRSIKITSGDECRKYYKGCKEKKVILLDFGNGNIKYIPISLFTKKQAEKIVETIESRRQSYR